MGRLPDGRVIFVPLTAPGDRVRVRIEEDRGRFARGSLDTLLGDGPTRCEPLCPVFGNCGGCAWQHIRYEDQLEAKRTIVADALTRIGGFELKELPPIEASPDPYHYRSRTRVLVRGGLLGYRRRRSHRLCAINACPVLAAPVEALLSRLAEAPESFTQSTGEDALGRGSGAGETVEEEWELCAGSDGLARSWRIPDAELDKPSAVLDSPHDAGCAEGLVVIEQGEDSLQISPGVFMQANALLWRPLTDAVLGAATQAWSTPRSKLLELFAGAGFFTLPLSRSFGQVVAVESDERSVVDLFANLVANQVANVEVVHAPVEQALCREMDEPDCVVLDPPRAGLARDAIERLAELRARRIVYLSCDPATLARDLRLLCEAVPSYGLTRVSAFDLFPQTPHVEALVVLEQGIGAG